VILALIAFAALAIVVAINDTQGDLFAALRQDMPQFVVWAAAIVALGIVGFVPGLKPISRGLLALVVVAIILNNYRNILAGFQNSWANVPASPSPDAGTGATPVLASGSVAPSVTGNVQEPVIGHGSPFGGLSNPWGGAGLNPTTGNPNAPQSMLQNFGSAPATLAKAAVATFGASASQAALDAPDFLLSFV